MPNTVVLQYEADIAKFKAQLGEVESRMGAVESSAKKSATNTQSAFNKAGSDINSSWSGLMTKVAGYVSAAFAVEKVIEFGKASFDAFVESERGEKLLLNALKGRTDVQERLIEQAKILQKTTVVEDDAIISQQAFLAAQGRTEEQIKKTITAALNLSAVTGDDLGTAVEKLDATFEGNIGRLGKIDERFKSLTHQQLENGAAIDLINEKYKGFAEAQLNTVDGKMKQLKNNFNDLMESLGSFSAEIVSDVAPALNLLMTATQETFRQLGDQFEAFSNLLTGKLKNANDDWQGSVGNDTEALERMKNELSKLKEGTDAYLKLQERINNLETSITGIRSKQPKTLAELRKNLQGMQEDLENLSPGTKDFTLKQKEIKDLSEKISIALGQETESTKKLREARENLSKDTSTQHNQSLEEDKKLVQEEENYKLSVQKTASEKIQKLQEDLTNKQKTESEKRKKIEEEEAEKNLASANAQTQAFEKLAEERKRLEFEIANEVTQIVNTLFDLQKAQRDSQISDIQDKHDKEVKSLEEQHSRKRISDRQYERSKEALDKKYTDESNKIKQKEAKAARDEKLFNIAIQTAENIVKAFPNPVLIALASALGIAEESVVASESLPKYKKGTLWVNRGNNPYGNDTIPAMLDEGEAVIPSHLNRKYKPLIEDIFYDRESKLLAMSGIRKREESDALIILAKALQQSRFDDTRLAKNTAETNVLLKKFLSQSAFNTRKW